MPMPWTGLDGDRDLFSCALDTGDYVGLVWYSFRLERLDGKALELPERQLTVYDGAHSVPAWFGEGVTYQIFPDRFRRTCVPDPAGMVGGRSVHTGWFEEPVWQPDARGEVRNRDFFGGSLAGVEEKLDYLQSLGVETLYFCPSSRRRRITATAPPTTSRWTPCWVPTRTSRTSVPTGPGASG